MFRLRFAQHDIILGYALGGGGVLVVCGEDVKILVVGYSKPERCLCTLSKDVVFQSSGAEYDISFFNVVDRIVAAQVPG